MTIVPLLWPIVLCLVVISSATALLLATTRERLIVLPALDHHTPVQRRADVHINGKGR